MTDTWISDELLQIINRTSISNSNLRPLDLTLKNKLAYWQFYGIIGRALKTSEAQASVNSTRPELLHIMFTVLCTFSRNSNGNTPNGMC